MRLGELCSGVPLGNSLGRGSGSESGQLLATPPPRDRPPQGEAPEGRAGDREDEGQQDVRAAWGWWLGTRLPFQDAIIDADARRLFGSPPGEKPGQPTARTPPGFMPRRVPAGEDRDPLQRLPEPASHVLVSTPPTQAEYGAKGVPILPGSHQTTPASKVRSQSHQPKNQPPSPQKPLQLPPPKMDRNLDIRMKALLDRATAGGFFESTLVLVTDAGG